MGTDLRPYNKAYSLGVNFLIRRLPWQHQVDVCIPIFGSFRRFFFLILCNIMEMILPDILKG